MGEWREFGGVNERKEKQKIQYRLTKPKAEKTVSANLVSFRRLCSPPKNEIDKKRRDQFNCDPDYRYGSHRSFLSLDVMLQV